MPSKKKSRNTGQNEQHHAAIRRLIARTDPDNWPFQEAHTLDEIIRDRSVFIPNINIKEDNYDDYE